MFGPRRKIQMKLKSLAIGLACAIAFAAPTLAQTMTSPTSFQSGNVLVRLRVDGVIPENFSSSVTLTGSNALAGSKVNVSSYVIPEIDLSYFFTPSLSIEAIAGTSRHNVSATTPIGTVKVGSTWLIPPIITLQYHFPEFHGFIPYVGAGVAAMFFYNTHPAEGGIVNSVYFNNGIGPALEIGVDYNISGNWYGNFAVKQSYAGTEAHINHGEIIAKTALNPTVIGVGFGYLF
jgi:outer membrane protein